jgi:LDH2 family malate/lactate/ureidoglycolate dehydrogenase
MEAEMANVEIAPHFIMPEVLREYAAAILRESGVPPDDARLVAHSLVEAERWGHTSHGVLRLSWYVARINAGVVRAVTEPETVIDGGAIAVIDGHDGMGQVITTLAMTDAVRRAKAHGVGVVGVRNSNHFGTAAYYTRMAAAQACIGFLSTNASPSMAPWGGRKKAIGANPWSFAAPAGRFGTVVMDIANGHVARGKIYVAQQRGTSIPEGWAIDADGRATTDPAAALAGVLLPMAAHKGYAISFVMDMLSGVLTGSSFGASVVGPQKADQRSGAGHLAMAFDISRFMPPTEFEERMEQLIGEMKSVPLAEGFDEILVPGEIEMRSAERADRLGVEVPDKTREELTAVAEALSVPSPF